MKFYFKIRFLGKFIWIFSVAAFCLASPTQGIAAKTPKSSKTNISHKPIKYFVSGSRIKMKAKVKDPAGVSLVRCYFKGRTEADYVFVEMSSVNGKNFNGILPAPSVNTEIIDYLFLVVNSDKQVIRTQVYHVEKVEKDYTPGWQQARTDKAVQVYSELPNPPSTPPGFSDSVTMDVVESAVRFGFVAEGIYMLTQMDKAGGSAAAAAGATAAGTITATAGLSTAAVVGLAAGGIAAGAGAAAIASGSSDGDDDTPHISSRIVDICVIDHNAVQDEYFNLYVNDVFIGEVRNAPGGTTCHDGIELKKGKNLIELRITNSTISDTALTISVNDGEWEENFSGDDISYEWELIAD